MPNTAMIASPMNFSTVPLVLDHRRSAPRRGAPSRAGRTRDQPLAEVGRSGRVVKSTVTSLRASRGASTGRRARRRTRRRRASGLSAPQRPHAAMAPVYAGRGTLSAQRPGYGAKSARRTCRTPRAGRCRSPRRSRRRPARRGRGRAGCPRPGRCRTRASAASAAAASRSARTRAVRSAWRRSASGSRR